MFSNKSVVPMVLGLKSDLFNQSYEVHCSNTTITMIWDRSDRDINSRQTYLLQQDFHIQPYMSSAVS